MNNIIVPIIVRLIVNGLRTIDEVPNDIVDEVKAELEKVGRNDLALLFNK